ncbi:MAG: hypothetical protein ETSY2_23865 [Candidatus Entotheonella gemina]|uniref:DUF1800 domain-containing protein n=1 Tax=Candidatus Entotheonella gemina TaxID=1429439 RepID=W4M5V6_9BACT|nr:MAG: hypothetical protein ETSY2_23865 [Candidatus Entotheonella gemina]
MTDQNVALMAHLMRRAGFGASRAELEELAAQGYDNVVEGLLNPESQPNIDEDLMMRYFPSFHQAAAIEVNIQNWVYRMVNTPRQLQEKMALFWHMIFCAGHSKIDSGWEMGRMVGMFREHGMGNFRDLLMLLSTSPAMMYYLDNTESHKVAVNENYGRELLELFSMGVGKDEAFNYSEDDVKACARAFTGWNVAPPYPPFPYGRSPWEFRYDPADHDASDKTFLGQTGNWNGDDIVNMIAGQPATARFISRHLYNFFVADEVPVPSWRQTPPKDPELIGRLEQAYYDSGYEISAMLRVLLTSENFKNARFTKVKNPTEVVVSTLRMVGEHRGELKPGLFELSQYPRYMGMDLMNPPTVEGWHTGHEWIDSGTLVERINFAADFLGKTELPGVQDMVERLRAQGDKSPEQFVDACADMVGCLNMSDDTRNQLVEHAQKGGAVSSANQDDFTSRAGEMFQMIAATAEYQLG